MPQMDDRNNHRLGPKQKIDQHSFEKGQQFERGKVLLYIQALSRGQNEKLVGGTLRQEFCRAIMEDIVAGRHLETCER